MTTWIRESEQSWIHKFCQAVLKTGPIPKHVAFIMDGNRRFASKRSIDRAQGHLMGFDKLAETLEWCNNIGISEVTVYAFSIENFKRSKEEVDGLMELARLKFTKLMEEKELLNKHGVCIRVLGNLSLLPHDIQQIVADAMNMTKNNNRAVLNVCFAYTAREEICSAMRDIAEGVDLGLIRESDISESVMEKCLYTRKSPHPDILVRTSGEVRLSDFLLWQTTYSCLSFVRVLWPEFSIWHLYAGILQYQRNYQVIQNAIQDNKVKREMSQRQSDVECCRVELLKTEEESITQHQVNEYSMQREKRIKTFLGHVEQKREQLLSKFEERVTYPLLQSS
ncbi:dehydrodolichyl diphosphate synthase complex subunit DHDDS [Lingula anatina]|uniref:Alkyl transferase n=1 Tax=Lingula anatina TaxID=7574 RepID=A0A1S3HL20_LINAN|nr:dehydrodolichyl diphosphate synthase complex subunit DHDDS [Lingula anatina]|eukprot:XP_013386156.1 dehydrodolichyl diphosphate synthase complex subunit DHDDS [Lingula anatina]